jgi:exodeoxyribonuclease-5
LQDALESAYSKGGIDSVMIICRSNKRATIYNKQIRSRILWREDEISSGDLLMVVKNNYSWLPENSKASFIANGDIIRVNRIRRIEEMYGFRFATLEIELVDYPDEPEIEVMIFLDLLGSDSASLPYENIRMLFANIEADFSDEKNKSKRIAMVKKSPYYNALQVKFAYAVTCHKAQGGQWPSVFIEQGFAPNTQPVEEHRWLYTALTRASETAYLINFPENVFA